MNQSNKPPGPQPGDGLTLDSLRIQFDDCAEAIAFDLCRIIEWLNLGAPADAKPSFVFMRLPDHLNRCRWLVGKIQDVTQRAERG